MKLKILLPILLLASIFFVQCKKNTDNPSSLSPINQVYYTKYNSINNGKYEVISFSFKNDGKLELFAYNRNDNSVKEFSGKYKINGNNIEANYSLGENDSTYTFTGSFYNDYKTIENGSVKLTHSGNTTEYSKFDGNISFLGSFKGEYSYKQGNTDQTGVIYLSLLKDNTIEVSLYLTQDDYRRGLNNKICVGSYHLGNGLLSGSFKNGDGTISFSFQDATITSDGKYTDIIEVPNGKLKITINGVTTYGKVELITYAS